MSSKSMNRSVPAAKRAERTYKARVRKLLQTQFGLSGADMRVQDEKWDGWLTHVEKERGAHPVFRGDTKGESFPLSCLLQERHLKDPFKARILAVLCAPTLAWTAFRYPTQNPAWSYVPEWFRSVGHTADGDKVPFIRTIFGLSGKLQQFFWALLEINLDAIGWNKPKALVQPTPVESDRNIAYNRLVLQALAALPVDDARAVRLFCSYHTNPSGGWLGLWLAGANYSPFQEMLKAAVPEHWKELADWHWRQEVLIRKTRAEAGVDQLVVHFSDEALVRYAWEVQESLEGKSEAVSDTLFVSQIEWILGLAEGTALRLFRDEMWSRALAMLRDERYQDTCYRFVKHMAADGAQHPFAVRSGDVACEIQRMLRRFGSADPELAAKLRVALAEHEATMSAWRNGTIRCGRLSLLCASRSVVLSS